VVLLWSALLPAAVLLLPPVTLAQSELTPIAVLLLPLVLLNIAEKPIAVFRQPPVRFWSAPSPSAVLKQGSPPSAPRAGGESAKQTSTKGIKNNPHHKSERLSELLRNRLAVLGLSGDILLGSFLFPAD